MGSTSELIYGWKLKQLIKCWCPLHHSICMLAPVHTDTSQGLVVGNYS